jgi:hypothetical protein
MVAAFAGLAGFRTVERLISISDYTPSLGDIVACPPVEIWLILGQLRVPFPSLFAIALTFLWNVATYAAVALFVLRHFSGIPNRVSLPNIVEIVWVASAFALAREAFEGSVYSWLTLAVIATCTRVARG